MKRLILLLAMILGWATNVSAVSPGALTTLHAIHILNNADAKEALPVVFEATVVYSRGYENLLFVQDGDVAIFVHPPTG
jgi:hypothetical protein